MVTAVVARGALAGQTGARIKTALGRPQVFDEFGAQQTFAQGALAGFSGARRVAAGTYTAFGPDPVYPLARVEPLTLDLAAGMGFQYEPGRTAGFAVLWPIDGQSGAIGATSGANGLPASAEYNRVPPLPGRFLCFNNGPYPLNAGPGGAAALATALTSAEIASVVDCADFINTLIPRDTPLFSGGLTVAAALADQHKVFALSFAIGSTSVSERWIGFTGSRAEGTVSITGTTATIDVTSGGGDAVAVGLILSGTGIAANTIITAITGGDPAGACTATVSVAQTVVGLPFETRDQRPLQYQNFVMALDAFAAWARGQNLTPIMPWMCRKSDEADGNAVAVANARKIMTDTRTVVNEFAARLYAGGPNAGQIPWIIDCQVASPTDDINHFPVTNEDAGNQNTPDLSLMGKVSRMTLGSLSMARDVDAAGNRYDTRWVSIAAYHQPSTDGARVHIGDDPVGYIWHGGDLGLAAIRIGNGLDARWPAILRAARTRGSLTVTLTWSEPCEFDGGELVIDPGQYGFRYEDSLGSIACSGFVWSGGGTVLTFTLATEPVGAETLSYACGNATLFDAITGAVTTDMTRAIKSTKAPYGYVSGGLASGGYPWIAPGSGMGSRQGQRGNVRATVARGRCRQTGRRLYPYANHQTMRVDVDAGTGTLLAMHTAAGFTTGAGLAPSFIADFGDAACYPGSGQTITDRSPSAALLWLGLDGTGANDPAYQAAASGLPAFLRFDGGGGVGVKSGQFCKAQGTPAFLDSLHKAGGAAILMGAVYLPTVAPPNTQYLLANCRNASGFGAGIALRVSTAGQPGINVRGATGGSVFSYNLPNPASKVVVGWNVFAIGLNAALNTLWSVDSNGSKFVTTVNTSTCTYSSPSTGDPESVPHIGGNYVAAAANIDSMVNGSAIAGVTVAPWTDVTAFLPVFNSLCDRLLLPRGPVPLP